jgi:ABC-type oligopeptide transport system substrate-binding subunit
VVKKHIPAGLGWAGGGARRLCFRRNGSKKQKAERSTINGKPESQSGRSLIAIGGPILALLAALALPLAAQDFVMNNGSEPQSLDPALTSGVPESRLCYSLFEGLVVNDAKTSLPVPGLSDKWTVSPDHKTYTFHIRPAKWSDGSPITAQDFVNSWLRVLEPKTAAAYAYIIGDNVEGAKAYNAGKGPVQDVKIKALDAQDLQVTFVGPLPYALSMLTHSAFVVTPSQTIAKFAGNWTKPGNFVGSGPFVLKTWRPQDRIVVEKNENYWDAKNVKLKSITYLPIEDQNVAYDKFKAGEIDYLSDDSVPVGKIDEVKLRKDYQHMAGSSVYYFIFNTTKPPFNDVRVRKALSMAVNRQDLVDKVLKAGDVASAGLVPAIQGFVTTKGNGFDLAEAKKLLAAAGFPNGQGFPKVHLHLQHQRPAQAGLRVGAAAVAVHPGHRHGPAQPGVEHLPGHQAEDPRFPDRPGRLGGGLPGSQQLPGHVQVQGGEQRRAVLQQALRRAPGPGRHHARRLRPAIRCWNRPRTSSSPRTRRSSRSSST